MTNLMRVARRARLTVVGMRHGYVTITANCPRTVVDIVGNCRRGRRVRRRPGMAGRTLLRTHRRQREVAIQTMHVRRRAPGSAMVERLRGGVAALTEVGAVAGVAARAIEACGNPMPLQAEEVVVIDRWLLLMTNCATGFRVADRAVAIGLHAEPRHELPVLGLPLQRVAFGFRLRCAAVIVAGRTRR